MRYLENVHLYGCTSRFCTGCVVDERPVQVPASTSDARKRQAEKVTASRAALVARGKSITPKAFELDPPTREEDR